MSSTFATALAVTAALGDADRAARILARIGGRDGVAARAAYTSVRDASAEELAAIAARLRAPRPAGLDDVHPEWLAPAPLRASSIPAVRTWLDRAVAGALVAMPAGEIGRITSPVDLARARPDWIALRLERVGLRQLAHATAGAERVELAALAARLGLRGPGYVEAIAKVRELGAAAAARFGPRRAAQARCEGVALSRDRLAFLAIGARAIAPHVASAGGDLPRQIAQRLPRAPGRRALDELTAWGGEPLASAPVWDEILSAS